MPATTAALAKLQQSFTTPSIEEIQKNSPCAICWADYDEGIMSDTPIKLRCRHVFGEKCILKWAKGKTPSGYRNGCPLCHADLLPQSLWTNLCSWVFSKLENFFTTYPPTDEIYGGTSDVVLGLLVILIGILVASDRLLGTSTAHGSTLFDILVTSDGLLGTSTAYGSTLFDILVTSDGLLGTSTAHGLTLFLMAYTSYQGAKAYGCFFGLMFGFSWGVLVIIAFRMIILVSLLLARF